MNKIRTIDLLSQWGLTNLLDFKTSYDPVSLHKDLFHCGPSKFVSSQLLIKRSIEGYSSVKQNFLWILVVTFQKL